MSPPERMTRRERQLQMLRSSHVPVAKFRDAFLQSGLTISEFARRMGYVRTYPNIDRARRVLGLRPDSNSRGRRDTPREFISYGMAKRICDALELDYVDMDI